MNTKLSDSVSVDLIFDHLHHRVYPKYVLWGQNRYHIDRVGLRHSVRDGRTLYHVFSVVSGSVFLRLKFNTDNLTWMLEEVSDGLPD